MVRISSAALKDACVCATKRQDDLEHPVNTSVGDVGTLDYRVHFSYADGKTVSPWHSVPLYSDHGLLNFVCEIPKNTRAKFEVATTEAGNPIKQDSKKGKPRSYGVDMPWNYGMFPQTWEDPSHASEDCAGFVGDNDPLDVVEIGENSCVTGGIYSVKPVAAFAMIDEGELDWKVAAISSSDPRCQLVHDVEDMEVHFPGTLSAIREWFRTYKTFEGKPENKFELEERAMNHEYTLHVISQTHQFWKNLVQGAREDPSSFKVVVGDVPVTTSCFELEEVVAKQDQEVIADKIKSVLEAVSGHEAELVAAVESSAMVTAVDAAPVSHACCHHEHDRLHNVDHISGHKRPSEVEADDGLSLHGLEEDEHENKRQEVLVA